MIKCLDLDYRTMSLCIDEIIEKINNGKIIILDNKVERETENFVVTSLIGRIPLNTIHVYRKGDSYIVIDSNLLTIINDFLNDKFKYDSHIDGFNYEYFSEFPVPVKRRINETRIDFICFEYQTDGIKEYIEMFSRNHNKI